MRIPWPWRVASIESLCRQSGWLVMKRDHDRYLVRAADNQEVRVISVRTNGQFIRFTAEFPVRFSLEKTPSGLFTRVLLRNFSLGLAHWILDIGHSCEGTLSVTSQLPATCMTAGLFDLACREIRDELVAFHQELRDKFRYDLGGVVNGSGTGGSYGSSGQPLPEVRFLGPVDVNTVLASRRRLPGQGD